MRAGAKDGRTDGARRLASADHVVGAAEGTRRGWNDAVDIWRWVREFTATHGEVRARDGGERGVGEVGVEDGDHGGDAATIGRGVDAGDRVERRGGF